MVSFDLADGYYALGINEADRDCFTVDYRGTLCRLAGLPMGWRRCSYYFCKLAEVFFDTYAPTPWEPIEEPELPVPMPTPIMCELMECAVNLELTTMVWHPAHMSGEGRSATSPYR
eukprot:jgi/Tetstr1/435590/TSEL_024493.t1